MHIKFLVLCAALFMLNSCNTTIGLYRDTKAAFLWTKGKIQGSGGNGGSGSSGSSGGNGGDAGGVDEEYGAPVY